MRISGYRLHVSQAVNQTSKTVHPGVETRERWQQKRKVRSTDVYILQKLNKLVKSAPKEKIDTNNIYYCDILTYSQFYTTFAVKT